MENEPARNTRLTIGQIARIRMDLLCRCFSWFLLVVMLLGGANCSKRSDQGSRFPTKARHRGVNLLLITIDTLRADYLSCYGKTPVATPHIDSLAAHGTRFTQAFAQVPLTPPSHASIMTGTYPPIHKIRDLKGYVLDSKVPTLATLAKGEKFETAAILGAAVLDHRYGLASGFDTYRDDMKEKQAGQLPGVVAEIRADVVTRRALQWLDQTQKAEKGPTKNFFLWVHYYDPHYPHEPPDPFRSRYSKTPYAGEIAFVDEQLGHLLGWFSEHGLADRTLMVLLSDHGESLGEHGEFTHGVFLYDSTMHIPLIVAGPGLPSGRVISQQVRSIDVMPTVADYFGFSPGNRVQGVSLMPAIAEGKKVHSNYCYMETFYPKTTLGWSELRGMRTEEWKRIVAPKPELYGLKEDLHEEHNLVNQHPADSDQLEKRVWEIAGTTDRGEGSGEQPVNQQTLEQLRSLGYASAGVTRGLRFDMSGPDPKDRVYELGFIGRADVLMVQRRFREANSLLEGLSKRDPTNPLIYEHLLTCYEELGLLSNSVQPYQRAIQNKADTDQIHSDMGTIYLRLGDRARAANSMEQAASLNPGDLGNLCNLATVYLELGRESETERVLRGILAQDNQHAAANNLLGVLEIQRSHPELARQYFEKAIQSDPNIVQAYMNLGILAEQAGQAQQAVSYYRKYLDKASGQEQKDVIRKVRQAIADLERKS